MRYPPRPSPKGGLLEGNLLFVNPWSPMRDCGLRF